MSGILTTAIGSWGADNVVVSITNQIVSKSTVGTDAYARYQLDTDGKVYKFEGTTAGTPTTYIEDWVEPNSEANNYECFATLDSGSIQTGNTGSWRSLASLDSMWGVADTGGGTQAASLTITIRKTGTTTNLTSATITLFASQS